MRLQAQLSTIVCIAVSLLFFIAVIFSVGTPVDVALAQDAVAATDTATAEPPTPTFTATPIPSTDTPTPTATPTGTKPPSEPVNIPEPITVVLFGTGLAALSAAAAARRKQS